MFTFLEMALTQSQIGVWLAAMRERKGLSQAEAGQRLRKDGQQISKWERGEKRMSAESFLTLVQLYDAQTDLLALLRSKTTYPEALPGLQIRVSEPDAKGERRRGGR